MGRNFPHFYFDFYTIHMNDLEKEIEHIRHELATTIPDELHNAMYSGDILESSEYSEILTRQYLLGVRLSQLNKRLHAMKSIDLKSISRCQVGVGSIVTLLCVHTNTEFMVKLVSSELSEVNSEYDEITLNSPVGKAIHNKSVNDEITVYTPSGIKQYKIINLITIHDIKNSS